MNKFLKERRTCLVSHTIIAGGCVRFDNLLYPPHRIFPTILELISSTLTNEFTNVNCRYYIK